MRGSSYGHDHARDVRHLHCKVSNQLPEQGRYTGIDCALAVGQIAYQMMNPFSDYNCNVSFLQADSNQIVHSH